MSYSVLRPEPRRRLQDVVSQPGYAARAIDVIQQISQASTQEAVVELLHQAAEVLGVEQALFVSFIRDDDSRESFRFMLACDPVWCMAYQNQGWYANDPWLLYASAHSEPISSAQLPLRTKSQREAVALAAQYGMVSAYIVPAPSSGGVSRLGVLALGTSSPGYFETPATTPMKLLARTLSMELHEWWVRQVRSEIIANNRITPEDLELLSFERKGMTTKAIAEALNLSPGSVDNRFQRLNAKFNTANRRATARLAAEYGLI